MKSFSISKIIIVCLAGVSLRNVPTAMAWLTLLIEPTSTIRSRTNFVTSRTNDPTPLWSTPFEVDLYDDDSVLNPYGKSPASPIRAKPDTKLVLGLNKYSHDTALCAANAETGEVLFALSKERLTRRKHDAGNVATLVETCLEALDLDLDCIQRVVMNNHHHRILPLEANARHLEWECGLQINGGTEVGYDDQENLLTLCPDRMELSHHLAHAYSAAAQCEFDRGLIVVMDGMGETYRTMMRAKEIQDPSYVSDFTLNDDDDIALIPSDIAEKSRTSYFDWREAESVYTFSKTSQTVDVRPIFKRFTQEHSPPTLYNHGFENMDSVGALYSRAASDIFGDWNACGKVMGLAPWMVHSWQKGEFKTVAPRREGKPIMTGTIYSEGDNAFEADRSLMEGQPLFARTDPELFDAQGNYLKKRRYDFDDNEEVPSSKKANKDDKKLLPTKIALDAITLAHRIQTDLEDITMDFVKHFKEKTKEENLCLAGGVALNSVLNGRLARELRFQNTFIPPYPGDDGIAVGCCAFGLYGLSQGNAKTSGRLQVWDEPLTPYLGPQYTKSDIEAAIEKAAPWLEVEAVRNEDRRVEIMAQEVESGGVVAWYQGRSELGPRALGHRSILADPRKKGLVRFINQHVKKRETFRPFAPSVLAEEAHNWFDLGPAVDAARDHMDASKANNVSPYMSMTAFVHKDKRTSIPAVTHVDGSSRLQTVTKEAEPLYHKFISKFFERTGIPMVLNTSFNTLPGEPIVETPHNAIRSFLSSMGSIEMLVIGDYIVTRKKPDLRRLLGETTKDEQVLTTEPGCPTRAGPAYFQSSFELTGEETDADDVSPATKVRMPDRPMHDERNDGWFELKDELEGEVLSVCDGSVTLNEILAQYTASPEDVERSEDDMSDSQLLAEGVIQRLVRLYEHTLISW